jgi:putative drug exporter of the RND superfamily
MCHSSFLTERVRFGPQMFFRLGQLVARHWPWVVAGWIVILVTLRWLSPAWDDVTHDGDLAYLPESSPSVRGEMLLEKAFPSHHAKSQFVVILAREDGPLKSADLRMGYDAARRLKNLHGATLVQAAQRQLREQGRLSEEALAASREQVLLLLDDALAALDEAATFDQSLSESNREPSGWESLPEIYWNRSLAAQLRGEDDSAEKDLQRALVLEPKLAGHDPIVLPQGAEHLPILDVWTWRDDVFGRRLVSADNQARLIVVRIANEFLAVRNQPLLQRLEQELSAVRDHRRENSLPLPATNEDSPVRLVMASSGSAAIGGDMLLSAKESIEDTELFTVLLIVAILAFVYRSPLLVLVPLVSIVVALMTSTSLIALLAAGAETAGPGSWWHFKIFTTTKIFIVVILFGAGTDYCLFLISRYREELLQSESAESATARALAGVGDALAASALTTIFGLSMMFFSDFGKLRFSGPVIGFCLFVGLLVCLTLTPALLHACGRWIFWPGRFPSPTGSESHSLHASQMPLDTQSSWTLAFWRRLADLVVRRPGLVLVGSLLLLLPLVPLGLASSERVTYDVLSGLHPSRPSRVGATTMRNHFPVGQSGPLTVVLHVPEADFLSTEGKQALTELTGKLYQVDGVRQVNSVIDPLGEFPPGTRIGLTNRQAWRTWLARSHRKTNALFLAQTEQFPGNLTRLEVILQQDPFSREAIEVLERVDEVLHAHCDPAGSFFRDCQIAYAGPTAAVRDLRAVTQTDQRRIEWLVIIAVYLVLVVILRRPVTCLFLIGSVLLTYFVTLAVTEWVFAWIYAEAFTGLDWKVPLFLFVILVAVGQDYNVYLVTRVIEEQQTRLPLEGLRVALIRTGGIITSCGVIMAGTFFSMTSVVWGSLVPDWLPWLQGWLMRSGGLKGMVELGFALALGVLLDTFLVRPILVPAFLALTSRKEDREGREN